MLGDFLIGGLVLILGYAYPAFECFKTVEKNKVDIEELRFWCQYWIIVAVLTVFERIGDIFISWLPMYGEMKLALIIYLWYPKTKGSGYVYDTLLRPYLANHETEIDRKLQELRARAWDLAIYYWQNCAKLGQSTVFQMIQYLASQSARVTQNGFQKSDNHCNGPPPAPPSTPSSFKKHRQNSEKRQPWIPPPSPTTTTNVNRSVFHPSSSKSVQVHLHSEAKFIHSSDDMSLPNSPTKPNTADDSDPGINHNLKAARLRLRRSSSKALDN